MTIEARSPFRRPILSDGQWQLYYLRKKHRTEQVLNRFIHNINKDELTPMALSAIEHGILHTNGKRVRQVLTHLVYDLIGGHHPHINELAILAELPHRGSLMEDDIDDRAKQRDGKCPAFRLFGRDATMEACAFLYRSPVVILSSSPINDDQRQAMIDQYIRLSNKARSGQEKDVSWGRSGYIPSYDEYLQMCEEKCAAFEFAIRVGTKFGGASDEQTEVLVSAGNKTATAFQLVDDLISLRENSDDFGSDITEGKKTLPVINTVTKQDGSRLLSILSMHTHEPNLINEAILILNKAGAIKTT